MEPLLQSRKNVRARLFAAGTFFRARRPGLAGNKLSIQVVKYSATEGFLVTTNYSIFSRENVGDAEGIELLQLDLPSLEEIRITDLHTTAPRARRYSISCKIGASPVFLQDLGTPVHKRPFIVPGVVAFKITRPPEFFTPGSEIVIGQRRRIYQLTNFLGGWDIPALRSLINSTDPWIQMPARGFDEYDLPSFPDNLPPEDAMWLDPILNETFLSGGNGLPDGPIGIYTGPERTLIYLESEEDAAGKLQYVNRVLEWKNGTWVPFS